MKRILSSSFLLLGLSFVAVFHFLSKAPQQTIAQTSCDTYPHNWPQVQNDPQHTGYTDEVLGTTIPTRTWVYRFQPDKIHTQIQPIVYCGKVFIGTIGANGQSPALYALDAYGTYSGDTKSPFLWKYDVGGPIVNSVAAADGKVFFGAGDGAVYAINVDGSLAWKKVLSPWLSFTTAPVIAENKVFIGGRDGKMYAIPLDSSDGTPIWSYDAGSPILQTAAYNSGKVFFGTFDMHMYALNTSNGSLAWKTSQPLAGLSMKEFWPVVYDGKVIVRTESHVQDVQGGIKPGYPFGWISNRDPWFLQTANGELKVNLLAQGRFTEMPELTTVQDTVMNGKDPSDFLYKNMYIFNEDTSSTVAEEPFVVPHWTIQTFDGVTAPPCVDISHGGTLIVPVLFTKSTWGRLDLTKQRITDVLFDNHDKQGNPFYDPQLYLNDKKDNDGDTQIDESDELFSNVNPAGSGNTDENLAVTCTRDMILAFHIQEGNANYTGGFYQDPNDATSRRWIPVSAGSINNEMSSNVQGPANPASVSNGFIYHNTRYELVVRKTQ